MQEAGRFFQPFLTVNHCIAHRTALAGDNATEKSNREVKHIVDSVKGSITTHYLLPDCTSPKFGGRKMACLRSARSNISNGDFDYRGVKIAMCNDSYPES